MLPLVEQSKPLSKDSSSHRILITAEGFEERTLSWIKNQPKCILFSRSIICKYDPEQKGKFDEVFSEVSSRTALKPTVIPYNRFDPTKFEQVFRAEDAYLHYDEIIIDITVMSKLLIMIIFGALKSYGGNIRVIYTEPKTWSPSEKEYKEYVDTHARGYASVGLSSIGVYDIIRTPGLSSIIMQDCQPRLITFTSSNEHLLNVLLNEVVPTTTLLINAKNDREPWRADAALSIHQRVIESFGIADSIECFDLLDYQSVFARIAKEYSDNCYRNRIVLAPTGGKVHTIACALLKNCCSDIQIEYPTPEGYVLDTYSSAEIEEIHEILFSNYKELLSELAAEYKLNG